MLQLTDTPGPTGMEVTRPRLVHSGAPSHSKKTLPPWAWRPPPTAGARRAMALAPAARKQSPGRPGRRAAPPRSLAASRGGAGGCPSGGGGGGGGDPSREGKRTAACRGSVGAGGGAASTRFRRSRTPLTVRAAATTYPPSTPGCCRGGGRGSDRDVLTAGLFVRATARGAWHGAAQRAAAAATVARRAWPAPEDAWQWRPRRLGHIRKWSSGRQAEKPTRPAAPHAGRHSARWGHGWDGRLRWRGSFIAVRHGGAWSPMRINSNEVSSNILYNCELQTKQGCAHNVWEAHSPRAFASCAPSQRLVGQSRARCLGDGFVGAAAASRPPPVLRLLQTVDRHARPLFSSGGVTPKVAVGPFSVLLLYSRPVYPSTPSRHDGPYPPPPPPQVPGPRL